MAKLKGLGRGLDALLGADIEEVAQSDVLKKIAVGQLQPGKYQPRSHMDQEALQALAESIQSQGIMQPILVRAIDDERYEIIAGERRWRASQLAGLTEVPVIIRSIADEAALAMALIENIQRENLNPLEEAQGLKRLISEFDMTHELAAKAVGRSRVAVSNLLRLLTLANPVQTMLMEGKLDMGHARTLIGLEPARQILLAEQIVQEDLSVREAELLVKREDKPKTPSKQDEAVSRAVKALQNTLSEKLGATVVIAAKANGSGILKVSYANLDQLDDIVDKLSQQ